MILIYFVFVLVSRETKILTGFVVCIEFDLISRLSRDDTVCYQILLALGDFGWY